MHTSIFHTRTHWCACLCRHASTYVLTYLLSELSFAYSFICPCHDVTVNEHTYLHVRIYVYIPLYGWYKQVYTYTHIHDIRIYVDQRSPKACSAFLFHPNLQGRGHYRERVVDFFVCVSNIHVFCLFSSLLSPLKISTTGVLNLRCGCRLQRCLTSWLTSKVFTWYRRTMKAVTTTAIIAVAGVCCHSLFCLLEH